METSGSRSVEHRHPTSGLIQLLDRVESAAGEGNETSLRDIVETLGPSSFAPLMLFAGLVILAPVVGDVPGVPVLMGTLVILVAIQIIIQRDYVWLPKWLLSRSVSSDNVRKSVCWLRKPARFLDRYTRKRYVWLVAPAGVYVIAAVSIAIAAATPIMEVVPFSANFAGAAITAFGLALIRRDGLIALAALIFSLCAGGFLLYQLLS